MSNFLKWLGLRLFPKKRQSESVLRQTTRRNNPRPRPAVKPKNPNPDVVELSTELSGRIEDGGPGKNVLIRNKYIREDTGTHDTLKIIDDSVLDDEDEQGFDPYNTGRFDRSKSWNLRNKN